MGSKRVAVVVNPVKVGDVEQLRAAVTAAVGERGYGEPVWMETTVDDPGQGMARQAVDEGVDLVIVAGGDGTVRVVCVELANTGIPLVILPAGTGNLLARNLGIPLTVDVALTELLDGADRTIDLADVEGDELPADRFTVMAGLGLDAAIIEDAPDPVKKRIGWAAYAVALARNLNQSAVKVSITVDDRKPFVRHARTVVIGNVGTLTADIALIPDARPDDGLIDVVVLSPNRLSHWPRVVWRILSRSDVRDPHIHRRAGRRITVTAAEPMRRQLDGDPTTPGRTLTAVVAPNALTVRSPKTEA
ncbi:diacylglycerol kinase family lipid kinase [Kribbella sandramycini]|uniref:Diacylglycerol kinase family lipid kinase n=1 Tax=Kribbella sandramycini TaxID=60450 RepID=A0A7Y4NZN3_9ACTN|nr:diacylglycerol kinase family protein [Kribbella sandramycini]MBB6569865.1 YegS/Rv2252/BmrU family lipid kinase [Kribbella sandramycini]NOL40310.1 diacylglycerol kinase family lipid kinase [Kribbella sandramycini]